MSEVIEAVKALPESFTSADIREMMKRLRSDVALLDARENPPSAEQKATILHKRHLVLASAYPLLYHRGVRSAVDDEMLETLLTLKELKDSGSLGEERARELVVDGAKAAIARGKRHTVAASETSASTTVRLGYDAATNAFVPRDKYQT